MAEIPVDKTDEYYDARLGTYCDAVRLQMSPYTFNFEFSQSIPPDENHEAFNVCLGRILMSPGFGKIFYLYLGDRIKEYEEMFGPITLPRMNSGE